MRVAIREQLAFLVLLAVLVALAIVSIPVWIYVNQFVVGVTTGGLSLTASLRAAQIASELALIQTTCNTITSRLLLQTVLSDFYHGNDTKAGWATAGDDLRSALDSGLATGTRARLMQARVYSRNATGQNPDGLLNVTGTGEAVVLPSGDDDMILNLGDGEAGYPPALYPNITYYNSTDPDPLNPGFTVQVARPFPDIRIDSAVSGLILGPLMLSEVDALVSFTTPIRQNTNSAAILGYMTVVADASSIIKIAQSQEGLGSTGSLLIVGPATGWNRFSKYNLPANSTHDAIGNFSQVDVRFVLPPVPQPGQPDRHTRHNFADGTFDDAWKVTEYDAVYKAFTDRNTALNNASSMLWTENEQDVRVAVGYARPPTALVNWTVIVEQDTAEAETPIRTLRQILLGCVFGTACLICLLIFPCAHFSVKPIRELKAATEKSVAPPGADEGYDDDLDYGDGDGARSSSAIVSSKSEKGMMLQIKKLMGLSVASPQRTSSERGRQGSRTFKIPSQVKDRKHIVTDELTELTTTFNEMSRELEAQYTSLEEKVIVRTQELEISKKAAEAANESKTLFIANISHELKTPLNGILGMCAICMEEDDMLRIKQSLKTLYKSGDLLLHLLEDLLSFSKNQIGQQLALEEREFRLGEIRSQILTIFDKQVREGAINFSVAFVGTDTDVSGPEPAEANRHLPALGPTGTGRIKDMCLWGDQHRILQVLINLVSNSLKFTPSGGRVAVRIRCLHEIEHTQDESRSSSTSRNGSSRGRARRRVGSGSNHSTSSRGQTTPQGQYKGGTVLSINPMDPKVVPQVHIRERSQTPPPPNAKSFMYEFEVEDSGPGIAEHMHDRVFEPFVQADLGLSKKYGGTGLGLSICQQLAHLMGGHISLRSTVGVGTTFTMHIPLKYTSERPSSTASSSMRSRHSSVTSLEGESRKASITQASAEVKASVLEQQPRLVGLRQPFFAANPSTTSGVSADEQMKVVEHAAAQKVHGKLRVLVADDNKTNVEVVTRMLKLEDNYDVTIATDGQEAYDLVKANMEKNRSFDLILMDIQMPNLDGLQSTRLIRKMGYNAPIVALTAFSEESNKRECIESGMDEFLAKPIRRPALKQVLKKFATIPEEPETASLTKKNSSERSVASADGGPIVAEEKAPPKKPLANGDASKPHMNGAAKTTVSVSAAQATSP